MGNDTDKIKILREKTLAGVMDCKKALAQSQGDIDKALEILRKKGVALAINKASRAAKEGIVASYIHTNAKLGVLLEVNCETDFVAKNDLFKSLVKDLTMQIAASNPLYIDKENVPQETIGKISETDTEKFYADNCLMQQPFVKDPTITVKDLLTQTIAKIGENIVVRRFIRYQVGEQV
jgi:elongation factor Ts